MACQNNDVASCVKHAEILCKERGVRLTMQRKKVLEIINQHEQPLGAYEILQKMDNSKRAVAPPTVYRALDFLLEQGLIHRLETLHAFVGCHHPEHHHTGQFLICNQCGQVEELEDNAIADSLSDAAAALGFETEQRVVELTGQCASCINNHQ